MIPSQIRMVIRGTAWEASAVGCWAGWQITGSRVAAICSMTGWRCGQSNEPIIPVLKSEVHT